MSGWNDVENEQRSGVDVENERAEWMWRMSERSGCGEYLMRTFICVWKKKILLYVFVYKHEPDI